MPERREHVVANFFYPQVEGDFVSELTALLFDHIFYYVLVSCVFGSYH